MQQQKNAAQNQRPKSYFFGNVRSYLLLTTVGYFFHVNEQRKGMD